MNRILLIFFLSLTGALVGCNHYVFVDRPEPEEPPVVNPDPDPDMTDSLVLKTLVYNKASLTLTDETWTQEAVITFENHSSSTGVKVLYDNYNSSIVRIFNNTYYVIPWAKKGQPDIDVPGLDSIGVPGFYGTKIPFAFGTSVIPRQFMPGHSESFDLPSDSKVTATVSITYRVVRAHADIEYFMSSYPDSSDSGWIDVRVDVPVDIEVEWSEIIPLK